MAKSIRIDKDVPTRMRDGVTLRADVYRPDDGDKHAAVVIRTPYNKKFYYGMDFFPAVDAALAGFAVVIQDTRGRFASEGEFMPGASEGPDGYDTIEWAAAEPWCDGNVGMAGGSYLARNQWQAAMKNPPHLKAIAPAISPGGLLSDTRITGVVDLEQSISWFGAMAVDMIDKMEREGKDVSEMRQMVVRAMLNIDEVVNFLPLRDIPHFKFEGLSEGFASRIGEELLSDLQSEDDLFWAYEKVEVPCLHSAGWYDLFVGSLFRSFLGMRRGGGSEVARQGQHLICGPWPHGRNLLNFSGSVHFGPTASGQTAFVGDRHIAFFDRYLRGNHSEYLVPLRYFVMGINRWRDADTWPLPETEWQRFYLHSQRRANSAAGDGLLSRDDPRPEPPDRFLYDPRFPVPTVGGKNLPVGSLVPGPLDQTHIEGRGDVLCYTTPELTEDIEVTGPLTLHLFASTSAKDTDFVAKLVDVYPDGPAYNIAEGCIRARNRRSLLKPELLNPGEVYEFVIDLAATSIVFRRGHRIRIDVSSSNFPRIDRNMNTGNAFGEDAEGIPAVQSVFHDPDHASYIDFPVIPIK